MAARLSFVFGFVGGAALLGGCASDRYLANPGHGEFNRREWTLAAGDFAKEAAKPGANQVLFLMDEGTARFAARDYPAAIGAFLKAEKLAEIKDYTSVSEEVGTLATSDNVRGYKGEDFEKVLINVYLAMAYAASGKLEDAQVEARKINQLLYRMIHDGKRNYQESPFARYLSAILWEADGNWNDAYIDYKKTYELDPSFPGIGADLVALARKMRFSDEEKEWKEKFPGVAPRDLSQGELVVLFEKGAGPVKIPLDGRDSSLPRYVSRYSQVARGRVLVNGQDAATPVTVVDVTNTSTKYLQDRINRMAGAKLLGTAFKGALAYGVGKAGKSEDLGMLAFIALLATDRADLRCWRTLPAELQLARIPLRPGAYDVKVEVLGWSGEVISTVEFPKLPIKAGQKAFAAAR